MLSILTTLTLAAAPQAVDPVGSLQRIDVPQDPQGTVVLDVELDGQPSQMILEAHSLRAADFSLYTTRPDGSLVEVPAPAPNTWRGTLDGRADTIVTATINGEGLTAIAADYTADVEWQIQPASGHPTGVYSVAKSTELPPTAGTCALPRAITPDETSGGVPTGQLGTGLQLCEIALDADFEFYQRNGSSVQATIDDMERVMNRVDAIYVNDVDVTFQLTAVVVRSNSNDPYTSNNPSTLLSQFRNHWSSNFVGVRRDLAHLFTGRDIQGGVIGIAFLGVVCSQSNGYGLSESRFTFNIAQRTGLTAHEIGHNFNSGHCDGNGDCRIMCSGLGGCQNDLSRFGNSVANGIRNYAVNRPCLLDLSPPLAVPFIDEFPSTSLNRDIWISQQGVVVNGSGVGEPTSPFAAELAARDAGLEKDDRLISNKILLGGQSNLGVSFFTQHRGVPAGGALDVEILDSSNDWVLLERVVSNGTDQSSFTAHNVAIPAGAYHDEAQLRITADVDGSSETWYIDDVAVGDPPCGGTAPYCIGASNSVSVNGAALGATGTTSIAANDLSFLTTSCPPLSFGIYIYGDQQTQTFLGNGFLCVTGNPVYRLAIVQADVFGLSSYSLDYNNLPPGSVIQAGDTFNFQVWYRDSVGLGYNLSNGLEVQFCP